jgi:hypothetical protein
MLTRLIVHVYIWIIEIYMWVMLLISAIAGYHYTVPILKSAGGIPENETAWRIYGALFFAIATFIVLAVVLGPLLLLVDIRKSVRALEAKNGGSSSSSGTLPVEPREPFL